jgi:hypothetical protein
MLQVAVDGGGVGVGDGGFGVGVGAGDGGVGLPAAEYSPLPLHPASSVAQPNRLNFRALRRSTFFTSTFLLVSLQYRTAGGFPSSAEDLTTHDSAQQFRFRIRSFAHENAKTSCFNGLRSSPSSFAIFFVFSCNSRPVDKLKNEGVAPALVAHVRTPAFTP